METQTLDTSHAPAVSVILPFYQTGEELEDAIQSAVLERVYENILPNLGF